MQRLINEAGDQNVENANNCFWNNGRMVNVMHPTRVYLNAR